jgi:hypothetical protein
VSGVCEGHMCRDAPTQRLQFNSLLKHFVINYPASAPSPPTLAPSKFPTKHTTSSPTKYVELASRVKALMLPGSGGAIEALTRGTFTRLPTAAPTNVPSPVPTTAPSGAPSAPSTPSRQAHTPPAHTGAPTIFRYQLTYQTSATMAPLQHWGIKLFGESNCTFYRVGEKMSDLLCSYPPVPSSLSHAGERSPPPSPMPVCTTLPDSRLCRPFLSGF